jgi:hypothetical protein
VVQGIRLGWLYNLPTLLVVMSLFAQLYAARWTVISVLLALYVASKYRQYRRLSDFKGPFSTGWSDLWHAYSIISKRPQLYYQGLNDKYGKRGDVPCRSENTNRL